MAVAVKDTARCFAALRLGANAQASITELLARLERERADVRWVKADNVHVTLRFLGEVERPRLAGVEAALRAIPFAPLALGLDGLGHFPPRGQPRVLWAGLAGDVDGLVALAAAIEQRLTELGFAPEERAFSSHLTLGRVKGPRGLEAVLAAFARTDVRTAPEPIAAFSLYESELRPQGPRYTELARVAAKDGG